MTKCFDCVRVFRAAYIMQRKCAGKCIRYGDSILKAKHFADKIISILKNDQESFHLTSIKVRLAKEKLEIFQRKSEPLHPNMI